MATNTLKHLRSNELGKIPLPAQMQAGQIAVNYRDKILFILDNDNNVVAIASAQAKLLAESAVQSVNGQTPDPGGAVVVEPTDIGPFGVADLDANGKIALQVIPESILGAVKYEGTWNAATNTPTLPDPTTNKGSYWVVNTAGVQFGFTFTTGDWVISNGTVYEKVDALDGVTSVAGKTGVVVLAAGDIASGIFAAARLGATPGSEMVLTTDSTGAPKWVAKAEVGKDGTVTSVDVTVPSALLAVSGGPVTTSGTFNLTLPVRAANLVFAGPASGSNAAPTFRPLVADDIPVLDEGTF